ncbi:MAG: glycosyltransferase family 2 protein [Chlorobi bacterium]|nr:glycosyltransferase family 2 protein [Chlorobiota bacterium]
MDKPQHTEQELEKELWDVKVSVIVPAYNEEENIPLLVEAFENLFKKYNIDSWEIIIVDDGSDDRTFQVASELAKKYPWLKAFRHGRNLGKTHAILTGFFHSRGKYIAIFDADLQFDEEDLYKMAVEIERQNVDLIAGYKVGKYEKKFVSRVYNWLTRKLFGVPVRDMNAMKIMRREVLEEIPLRKDWHRYIVALAWTYGFSVSEMPIRLRPRKFGESKYSGKWRIIIGIADLIAVRLYTILTQKPLLTFGTIGSVFLGLGIITGIIAIIMRMMGHGFRPILFLVVLLVIVGLLFFLMGFLGEVVASIHDEISKIRKTSQKSRNL